MSNKTDVKLTFAEITALPRGDRYTLFQTNVVKPFGAVAKAKEAVDEKMHNAMKLTASLKRDYASRPRQAACNALQRRCTDRPGTAHPRGAH